MGKNDAADATFGMMLASFGGGSFIIMALMLLLTEISNGSRDNIIAGIASGGVAAGLIYLGVKIYPEDY